MFNRDGIFGKKEDNVRSDSRSNANVTPGLGTPPGRGQPEAAPPERQAQEAPKPPAKAEDTKGSKLIVGPDIKLKGVEITDCDTLVVEGRVEAAMDSRVIRIASGRVFRNVGIDLAEIHAASKASDRAQTARHQVHRQGDGKIATGKLP